MSGQLIKIQNYPGTDTFVFKIIETGIDSNLPQEQELTNTVPDF